MINNFNKIKELLDFSNPDDFFYMIQIYQRRKENPGLRTNNRLIKTYYFHKPEDLEGLIPSIIEYCSLFNARAYISLNKKNQSKVILRLNLLLAEYMSRGVNSPNTLKGIFDKAAALTNSSEDKVWIVDVDTENMNELSEVLSYISKLQEGSKSKIITTLKTPNGFHIVTNPFRVDLFKEKYKHEIKKQANTLLYYDPK